MSETKSPAEVLREAAALMRSRADSFALAVADWLDAELDSASGYPEYVDPAALKVARTYLGRP